MKKMFANAVLSGAIGVLIFIIVLVASLFLSSLVFWGIGHFVCWAFTIPFDFTFWHGVACALVVLVLNMLFGNRSKK